MFIPNNSVIAEKLVEEAITNNPWEKDINNGQNKKSVLDNNSKATYEKYN